MLKLRKTLLLLGLCTSLSVSALTINYGWDASPSDGVEGYRLYYGPQSKTYTSKVDVGNVLKGSVSNLTDGQVIYAVVRAYKGDTESGNSNEVMATVKTPPVKIDLQTVLSAELTVDVTPIVTGGSTPYRYIRIDAPGALAKPIITTSIVPKYTLVYTTPGTYKIWFNVYDQVGSNLVTKLVEVK